jgi:hypothetical protein
MSDDTRVPLSRIIWMIGLGLLIAVVVCFSTVGFIFWLFGKYLSAQG